MGYVGQRVPRKEDARLLRGTAKFAGDVRRVGMLHAVVLRSPVAHASIRSIDTSAAGKLAGVWGVLTSADIRGVKPIPMRTGHIPGLERSLQYPLASDKVRYVGEPVAVVVAESRYVAEDALELIDVQYETLNAVTDTREAISPDAPPLHSDVPDNIAGQFQVEVGDIGRAMAEADLVIEEEFSTHRHSGVPIETRGLVAEFDEGGEILTIWGATKVVHINRSILAEMLDMPESSIHLVESDVGGGFGIRGEFYPEDYLIPFAAIRLRRPVSWIEDRSEHLKAANQARGEKHRISVAVKLDGTITGMKDTLLYDLGAYTRTHGGTPAIWTSAILRGTYKIQNYWSEVRCVLTNKTPVGTYRGPGRYEGAFVRERILDIVAHRLGLDPADVRTRNLVSADEIPYDAGHHPYRRLVFDSGDFPGQLRDALRQTKYEELKNYCSTQRSRGKAVGVGIACFVEKSGSGPWEYARVEVDSRGQVAVYSGGASLGQGIETILSQIVADELQVSLEDVRVIHGDTDLVPFGGGSFASRGTVMAGNAALKAAKKAKEKLLQVAAGHLEINPEELQLEHGRIGPRGVPGKSMSFGEIVRLTAPGLALKRGIFPGVSEEEFFYLERVPNPYGVHIALVEVDRETGVVEVQKYFVAFDVGRAINPALVESQIIGGVAQGLGGALLEEFPYDADGQPLATSFLDYLIPTAMEVPEVEILLTEDAPSPHNPLGVKGAGEAGTVGVAAALANAVSDALGVEVRRLPLKPEYVQELARIRSEKPTTE
jgi:CO/xanthine dehydrogenase Mo-binding subunit